jgi:hypothetical protein
VPVPGSLYLMKTLSCDLCSREFSAENFQDWFKQMYAHYTADHADVMAASASKPKSEGEKWMAAAKARFEAA